MSDEWLTRLERAAAERVRSSPVAGDLPGRLVFEELFVALPPTSLDEGYRLVVERDGATECGRIRALTGDADVEVTVAGVYAAGLAPLAHADPGYVALRAKAESAGAFTFSGDAASAAVLGALFDGLHDVLAASTAPAG